jgi:ferrous iron transport protein A
MSQIPAKEPGRVCLCDGNTMKEQEKNGDDTSISRLHPGGRGRVSRVDARGAVRQRLLDMGLIPGAILRVERLAPTGDPIWISLRGTQIALRRQEAEAVITSEV